MSHYIIEGNHKRFRLKGEWDRIILYNYFSPTKGIEKYQRTKGGETFTQTNMLDIIDDYTLDRSMVSRGYESEMIYEELDRIFGDHPLISTDFVALYYHTEFIDL